MSAIVPVDYQGQRILTSEQLSESYGATIKMINNNFLNNSDRFTEGKHYYCIEGDALRTFKREHDCLGIAPNVNKLYLWTEKGAWHHAKSLNTDAAWNAYESLVDEYYHVMETMKGRKTKPIPTWDKIAVGEIRFAKEFAKAAGIRTERALAVAIARVEHQSGLSLDSYRRLLPAVDQEEAEIFTASQIGDKLKLKANQVNLLLEEIGLQYGIREAGKREGKERLVKTNPWHLTDKGKEYGIMQDSSKQTGNSKWEGFQIYWNAKTVQLLQNIMAQKA